VFPGAIGGVNWGSAAYDPSTGILYANTNSLPYFVQLVPRKPLWVLLAKAVVISSFGIVLFASSAVIGMFLLAWRWRRRGMTLAASILIASSAATLFCLWRRHELLPNASESTDDRRRISLRDAFGDDHSPQTLAPYSLYRHPIYDSHGHPCSAEPWGSISALSLQTGAMVWRAPHGTESPGHQTGAPSLGGVMVTAGGLLFSAGTREPVLRAYDTATGTELWKSYLEVPAQATPMSYSIDGRQFVVIAAGGSGLWGTPQGDEVIAFAIR
jgi:quinoprotein glucose dehydrogenase